MRYEWRCEKCGEVIEVRRPVCDYDLGPDAEEARHQGCENVTEFTRIISRPMRIFVHENEDQYWG